MTEKTKHTEKRIKYLFSRLNIVLMLRALTVCHGFQVDGKSNIFHVEKGLSHTFFRTSDSADRPPVHLTHEDHQSFIDELSFSIQCKLSRDWQ